MADRIRLLIVEREPLFRRGVIAAVERMPGLEIVGEVGTASEGVRLARALQPDVALVGAALPDAAGLSAVEGFARRLPDLRIVAVGESDWDDDLLAALQAGAAAYLAKTVSEADLRETIARVAAGEQVIERQALARPSVAARALERLRAGETLAAARFRQAPLTRRELQVLRGISAGRTNAEIGDELGISAQTVKNHVTAILRKLGVSDRTQAVVLGLRQGWITLDDSAGGPTES
ncbi:MAG TPA: response regulator transcription factor [Thermomicrobiales bacterium]|nr:response regulator transcription factor [Thermomicrobiales bacterium]